MPTSYDSIQEIQQLKAELRNREQEIAMLEEIGTAISSERELARVLQLVADRAREILQAETVLIPTLNRELTEYTYSAGSGKNVDEIVNETMTIEMGVCGWVWRNKRAWWRGVLNELSDQERTKWEHEARTMILVPLFGRTHFLGGIAVLNKTSGEDFDERDLSLLTMFAGQVSIAIENAQLFEEISLARERAEEALQLKEEQEKLLSVNENLKTENEVRLQAERSLILYRDHLEKTVEQRTADLEIARDQALLANQAKSAFIANMSHEMRTPLTAIIGFGDFILDDSFTMEDRKNAAQTVSRNGHHLLTIINDILDMSKMEAGKLEVEKIPMSPFHLIADVASLINMQARDKDLQLEVRYEYPLPSLIISDATRLKQILLNLCANAVKFTTEGSVQIGIGCNADKQQMEFRVMDTGIGLSASAQQNLFGAFNQADSSTTRKFGGTGLGLFISKRLAQLLGGDIQVESEEGIGSTFTVTIDSGPLDDVPFILNEAAAGQIEEAPTIQHAKPNLQGKVLLAEDTLDNQRLISMYLRRAGITDITIVENGKLAVEHALATIYDLILMDMQMPVMGGLEAVTRLREAGYAQPIYALTANAMKEDQESYLAAGCTGFLSKPIDQQKFCAVLTERLTKKVEIESAENVATDEGEDEDEFEQMTRDFVTKLPTHRAALEEAFAKSDWDAAKSIAHKLKGIGGSFGFPEITRLATPLEASLKTGAMENVSVQHADLLAEIDRICAEVNVG